MLDHRVTLEWTDGAAELLALAFPTKERPTGRLIIRWGSGITSCVSALRWTPCTRCSGVGALPSESERCYLCAGRGHLWLREVVPRGYRAEALAGEAGDSRCRDLGMIEDTKVSIACVADGLAPIVAALRGRLPRSSGEHLRGVARWLLALRGKLMHGFELLEALECEGAVPVGGGSEVDDLLGALVALEMIEPHAFDPRPSAIFMPGDAKQAAGFARRMGNWRGWRGSASGPGGDPEPDASPVGAKHWLFQQGRKYRDIGVAV